MLTTSTKTSEKKKGKRILLVDDEPDITMAISIVLSTNGFEVYSFNYPILALSNFRPNYYDLVILDVKMPAMDGFEVYNEIKKIDSRVKVCFITATHKVNYKALKLQERETIGQEETSQQYCALDKDMFLQKPISNKDLVNEINKRIRDYR